MADFRRWITALAVLVLFAGLVSAQTGGAAGGQQMICNSVAQVTPTLRAEGVTELVGDIVITCSGGSPITAGNQIPQANLTVGLTGVTAVTSRLASGNGASEALLLIDEPNSGLQPVVAGFGPAAPFSVCASTTGGCVEYAAVAQAIGGTCVSGGDVSGCVAVAASTSTGTIPASGLTPGQNVFMGVVSGNQVSFNGIPILPPVTSGIQRVFRITNIRVNASSVGSGQVSAFLSFSGPTSLPISNPTVTVGVINTGLIPSVTTDKPGGTAATVANVNSFTQCNTGLSDIQASPIGAANVAILNYGENFPSAFKTAVGLNPNTGTFTSSNGSSYVITSSVGSFYSQNVPGTLYQSESGFILNAPGAGNNAGNFAAGVADSGTRLRAAFSNLPSGATIWVSRYNVAGFTTSAVTGTGSSTVAAGTTISVGAPPQGATAPSVAVFTSAAAGRFSNYDPGSGNSRTYVYSNSAITSCATPGGTCGTFGQNIEVVPLTRASDGTALASWEITNTNPSKNETVSFAVYISYNGNQLATNLPTPGSDARVTLSFGPLQTTDTTTWIPRFIAGPASTAQPLLNVVQCQTVLLFPYLVADGGFDTGVAIENTSKDPLGTVSSNGSCTLNFYGKNAPAIPTTCAAGTATCLGPINAGDQTNAAFQLSAVAPGFTGYMFAVCNFQYAHGFAFISDIGVRNFTMGYLALVVNNGVTLNTRGKSSTAYAGEALNQ